MRLSIFFNFLIKLLYALWALLVLVFIVQSLGSSNVYSPSPEKKGGLLLWFFLLEIIGIILVGLNAFFKKYRRVLNISFLLLTILLFLVCFVL